MIETESETLRVPLGDVAEASVHIEFGGGELAIGAAPSGVLLAGVAPGALLETTGPGRIRGPAPSPDHRVATVALAAGSDR